MLVRWFRISPETKRNILSVILIDQFAVFQETVPRKEATLHFVLIFSSKLGSIAYGHLVTDYLVSSCELTMLKYNAVKSTSGIIVVKNIVIC